MTASKAAAGLTMRGEKRAADPRTLFRPGGKSIGELARAIPVPSDIQAREVPEFRMDAFLSGPAYAVKAARDRAKHKDCLQHSSSSGRFVSRRAAGLPPPDGNPLNSARVAREP